jgi:transposase
MVAASGLAHYVGIPRYSAGVPFFTRLRLAATGRRQVPLMKILQYLGIDISQPTLVLTLKAKGEKDIFNVQPHDPVGIANILALLGDKVSQTSVVLEATSRFHLELARALKQAGAKVLVLNPARARALAIGLGILDKDDKVDSQVLAQASQLLGAQETELLNPLHQELRDLSRTIDSLTAANSDNKKRLVGLPQKCASRELLNQAIQLLKELIKDAKATWLNLLRGEEEIQKRYLLALSVKGLGPESSRGLACETPARLEDYRVDQLCAYAGVVPRRSQSGNKRNKDRIGKSGSSHLRTCVFMASSRTVFITKDNQSFYLGLRSKGRTHKQAMVAVVHRVLRTAFAVIKRGTPWQPVPPCLGEMPVLAGNP